ncbi:MAG: class I SAM-dependent methyltransferase [Candidatus Krumholzibacteriia bacterium]
MSVAEKLLAPFIRPEERRFPTATSCDGALELLEREYGRDWLTAHLRGRDVVDFGCGLGFQSVALARDLGCRAQGYDILAADLQHARELAGREGLSTEQARFDPPPDRSVSGVCDVLISQNSMEHYADPTGVLDTMVRLLRPGGLLLLSWGPPWYSPNGGHTRFFCRLPWVHLLFPEQAVLAQRARFRDDGATRYEEIEGSLNRMTVGRCERLVRRSGLVIEGRKVSCVRGLRGLGRVPGLREFVVGHVSYVLRRS